MASWPAVAADHCVSLCRFLLQCAAVLMMFSPRISPLALANLRMSDRLRALHDLFFTGETRGERSNHSGKSLSSTEFFDGIRPLVGTLTPFEENFLFKEFDSTRDGSIDLFEFDFTLFHYLQQQAGGDAVLDVRRVVFEAVSQKLAAFRSGAVVVDHHQPIAIPQVRGVGVGVATTRVVCSKVGILSIVCIVGVIVGIVFGIFFDRTAFWCAGICYAIHACLSLQSTENELLKHVISGTGGLVSHFDAVYRANATYRWYVSCYHYETRTRVSTDSKGHKHSHTENIKVITHTATMQGRLRSFDTSAPFLPYSSALTQLLLSARVQVRFAEYFVSRDLWKMANTRDQHQDFSISESVAELQPNLLVEYIPGSLPWYISSLGFAVATAVCASMCYTIAFNSMCSNQSYIFVKDVVGFAEDLISEEARMYDAGQAQGINIMPPMPEATMNILYPVTQLLPPPKGASDGNTLHSAPPQAAQAASDDAFSSAGEKQQPTFC